MKPEFWSISTIDQKMSLLWEHFNKMTTTRKQQAGFDENSHGKISMWIALKLLPQWRVEKLALLDSWSDSIWMQYYTYKEQLINGIDIDLPESIDPCPITFSQLLFE